MQSEGLFEAAVVTSHTLVCPDDEIPHYRGNCFSIKTADEQHFRVVNFNYENLEELQAAGLKFPIQCRKLGEGTAIFHDPRIGERWYSRRYCEVCCPESLLPIPQIQSHERDVMRGVRKKGNGWIQIDLQARAEFP